MVSLKLSILRTIFKENGRELEIFTKSPNNTLAAFIYKLGRDEPCFMMEDEKLNKLDAKRFKNSFLVGPNQIVNVQAQYVAFFFSTDMFFNPKSLLEVLRAFYISKRLSGRVKKFLDQWYAAGMLDLS